MKVGKNNPRDISREACRLLRQNGIVSFVNVIYGLEEETAATIGRTFPGLLGLDPDVVNACSLTPHSWTPAGRLARGRKDVTESPGGPSNRRRLK